VSILLVGLILQFLNPSLTTEYILELDICGYNQGYQATLLVFLRIAVILMAAVHWMIRNIKSSFNESREMLITCVTIYASILYVTIMNY
ncbi:hypothetical protein LPJ66_011244, partial [Kickxella alabastrina]